MQQKMIHFSVGILVILTLCAIFFIALHATVDSKIHSHNSLTINADFDNISGLRVKAPVKVAGVKVGEVVGLKLNQDTYQARVELTIDKPLPIDSQALILTEGLLGSKYIGIEPGVSNLMLANDSVIGRTVPAMILENLISKLVVSLTKDK